MDREPEREFPLTCTALRTCGRPRTISYQFREEFDGGEGCVETSEPDDAPHLLAVPVRALSQTLGRHVEWDPSGVHWLRAYRSYHGNAAVGGCVMLFFDFQEADTGLAARIPEARGALEVAPFRLTARVADPQMN